MKMKSDIARLLECVFCPYHEMCEKKAIEDPEDFEDGSCKTKAELKELEIKNDKRKKSV